MITVKITPIVNTEIAESNVIITAVVVPIGNINEDDIPGPIEWEQNEW